MINPLRLRRRIPCPQEVGCWRIWGSWRSRSRRSSSSCPPRNPVARSCSWRSNVPIRLSINPSTWPQLSSPIERFFVFFYSQSVKTTEMGSPERGYDGGKNIKGRKRHLLVDTLGLLLAVLITSARLDDGVAAPLLLSHVT